MKTIKQYDAWIQAIMIAVFIIVSLVKNDNTFLVGYFVVGGWQVLSTLIHALTGWFKGKRYFRYYYNAFLIIIAAGCLLSMAIPFLMITIAYFLLFFSPAIAIIYTAICFAEVKQLSKNPLASLK